MSDHRPLQVSQGIQECNFNTIVCLQYKSVSSTQKQRRYNRRYNRVKSVSSTQERSIFDERYLFSIYLPCLAQMFALCMLISITNRATYRETQGRQNSQHKILSEMHVSRMSKEGHQSSFYSTKDLPKIYQNDTHARDETLDLVQTRFHQTCCRYVYIRCVVDTSMLDLVQICLVHD